jgi:hypothetical protein
LRVGQREVIEVSKETANIGLELGIEAASPSRVRQPRYCPAADSPTVDALARFSRRSRYDTSYITRALR